MEGIWNQDGQVKPGSLGYNQSTDVAFNLTVPASQRYTQPFWLIKPATADVYQIDDQMMIGLPDTPAAASIRVRLTVDGTGIELVRPVQHRYADRAYAWRASAALCGCARGSGESSGAGGGLPGHGGPQSAGFQCERMWPTRKGDLRPGRAGGLEG